ncbi:hypothetical protein A6R68_13272 [Neotoma lepida]|uniref:Adipose-secreted signaling protein n=1 Tax=Neotoma lepida TaxID=56216 RepID=A0A1A6H2W0_NEOLE|nr:hypothetical protein A6R68_13272 [Neotoma lepida]
MSSRSRVSCPVTGEVSMAAANRGNKPRIRIRRLSKDIREAPVLNLHLKLLSVTPIPEAGYSIKCESSAHKEGVLKEEMLLIFEGDTGTFVGVMVQAQVMDRHHGTPMLLDTGVRVPSWSRLRTQRLAQLRLRPGPCLPAYLPA